MFAALLVVCSLNSQNCQLQVGPTDYLSEQACLRAGREYVAQHDEQLQRGFGPYIANLWCRKYDGSPA